ncbi:MAG: AMP-binding protein [Acidimicrobiales bacterium]
MAEPLPAGLLDPDMLWSEVTTLGDLLLRIAARAPDDIAVVLPHERLTYGELAAESFRRAASLRALGVERGDHVGILIPNSVDFIATQFAASFLGAVVVPINTRFRRRELSHTVTDGGLVTIVTSDIIDDHVDFAERLTEAVPGLTDADDLLHLDLPGAPQLRNVVLLGERTAPGMIDEATFDSLGADIDPAEILRESRLVRVRDVSMIHYTSGTTSLPKGCVLTHEAVVRDWIATGHRMGVRPGDKFWTGCPMFHMAGTGPMISVMWQGGTFVTQTHFDPGVAIDLIEAEEVTHIYTAFPTIAMAILRHPDYSVERTASVRMMMNVAPPDTLRLMQSLAPHMTQISAFGQTENCGTACLGELDDSLEDRTETSGRPLDGIEARIVDPETGEETPTGTVGEIHLRGYSTLECYLNDPEKTAATILPGGWIRTGDMGCMDDNGRVSYRSRLKDMLKVGGENVAPTEIEAQLSTHPAVQIAQVVGVPDETYGEVPVAFVELVSGATVTAEELIAHCEGEIASFKIPREVRFVDEWPMSATKIQKFKLREMLDV